MSFQSMFHSPALKKLTRQCKEKGLAFALRAAGWKIRTALFKRYILFQDERQWYTYADWLRENEASRHPAGQATVSDMPAGSAIPFTWIIRVPVSGGTGLGETLGSLLAQSHPRWQALVCLPAANFSLPDGFQDERITACFDDNCDLLEKMLMLAAGEWIGLLGCGDTMSSNALAELAQTITRAPDADVVYSDQDSLAADHQARQEFLPR